MLGCNSFYEDPFYAGALLKIFHGAQFTEELVELTHTAFARVQILQRVRLSEPGDTDVDTWWGRGGMCGSVVDQPTHTHTYKLHREVAKCRFCICKAVRSLRNTPCN